jgi:hypothetical protein
MFKVNAKLTKDQLKK